MTKNITALLQIGKADELTLLFQRPRNTEHRKWIAAKALGLLTVYLYIGDTDSDWLELFGKKDAIEDLLLGLNLELILEVIAVEFICLLKVRRFWSKLAGLEKKDNIRLPLIPSSCRQSV